MSEMLEKVARRIAEAIGDNLDDAFVDKSEWNAARGEKGGRPRDINAVLCSKHTKFGTAANGKEGECHRKWCGATDTPNKGNRSVNCKNKRCCHWWSPGRIDVCASPRAICAGRLASPLRSSSRRSSDSGSSSLRMNLASMSGRSSGRAP